MGLAREGGQFIFASPGDETRQCPANQDRDHNRRLARPRSRQGGQNASQSWRGWPICRSKGDEGVTHCAWSGLAVAFATRTNRSRVDKAWLDRRQKGYPHLGRLSSFCE